MEILLKNGEAVLNVKKIVQRSDIKEGHRLFYMLGRFVGNPGGWTKSGKYKEIKYPVVFRDADDRLDDIRFINHHGIVIH